MTITDRTPVKSRGRRVPGLVVRTSGTGQVFEYRARLDGRVVTRKLAARSKTEAVHEVEKLRSDARAPEHVGTIARRLTVSRLAEQFGEAIDADEHYSPRTRESLHSKLTLHIVPMIGRTRLVDLDEYVVRRFARALPTMKAKSHRNVVSALSAMLA